MELEPLGPIEAGTYFIDPDGDASTPLRVVYEVPADGWSEWIGAAKFSDAGHSGLSITTVPNLVTDGCHDHTWADPPVGPSVDDLAAALTDLAPFEVTSPPEDVTIYGYSGKHLEWTVPDLPVEGAADEQSFTGCKEGNLKSWVAFIDAGEPGDAFYGYTGPGYTEEFWILDAEGTRLMIAAEQSAGSPSEDIAERARSSTPSGSSHEVVGGSRRCLAAYDRPRMAVLHDADRSQLRGGSHQHAAMPSSSPSFGRARQPSPKVAQAATSGRSPATGNAASCPSATVSIAFSILGRRSSS